MAQYRIDKHEYLKPDTTIFEVMMLADQYGNMVGPANPSGMAVDAFGRARQSLPLTLFDSFHRYQDNGKISTANTSGGTFAWSANTASIDMTVSAASGASVKRETSRVFAYQPGKSLQILQTFVMNPVKTNLRQRIGYFGEENGFYLEKSDGVFLCKRSKVTGAVQDTRVPQAQWNIDPLDGTGPSRLTLNLDAPQILFTDIEWLGVGSVRMGFVIDGQLIHCHSFHHANLASAPLGAYMQTACLPLRAEIENTGTAASSSVMKIICSSVISEGGYELRGRQFTVGQAANTAYTMSTAGTWYPVVALRLKSTRLDGLVVPRALSLLGLTGNGTRIKWSLVQNATVTGGTWVEADPESCVEYNITATGMSGGRYLKSGFQAVNNQGSVALQAMGADFQVQLERNSFTSTPFNLVLAVQGAGAGDTCVGGIDWEEVT